MRILFHVRTTLAMPALKVLPAHNICNDSKTGKKCTGGPLWKRGSVRTGASRKGGTEKTLLSLFVVDIGHDINNASTSLAVTMRCVPLVMGNLCSGSGFEMLGKDEEDCQRQYDIIRPCNSSIPRRDWFTGHFSTLRFVGEHIQRQVSHFEISASPNMGLIPFSVTRLALQSWTCTLVPCY